MNSSTQTEGAKSPTVETRHDRRSGQYVPVIRWPDGHTTDQSPTSFDRDRALVIGEDVLRHMETRAINAFPDLVAALQEAERLLSNITQLSQPRHAVQVGDLVRCADVAAQQARAALIKAKA